MRKLLAEQEDSLKMQYKTAIDDAMKKIDSLTATVSAMQEKLKKGQCETDKKVKYLEKKINEIQESLEFSQKDLDMVRVMVEECCGLTRFEAELDSLKGQVSIWKTKVADVISGSMGFQRQRKKTGTLQKKRLRRHWSINRI